MKHILPYEKQRIPSYSKPYNLREICEFLKYGFSLTYASDQTKEKVIINTYKIFLNKSIGRILCDLRKETHLDILSINKDKYIIRYN